MCTVYIQKLPSFILKYSLVEIQVSKLTLSDSKEEEPTLVWGLGATRAHWPDWLQSFPFWEMFTNLSFVLIV